MDTTTFEDDEQQKKRQQLINFGHSQWGFNNWSWSVSKQDLDFVDFANGKYSVGVVAFVSVSIKTLDIHRENIGYATTMASMKGSAIYQARKGAVTNALRETLLSFGSNIAIELNELLETTKTEHTVPASNQPPILEHMQENNLNLANKPIIVNEPKNAINNKIKPPEARENPTNVRAPPPSLPSAIKSVANPPAVAKAQPIPANLPPAANKPPFPANQAPRPPPQHRPNPNEAKVLPPLEGMTEEEARAERKRRQRVAQEEFRLKQMMKHQGTDGDQHSLQTTSLDALLSAIPTQDIVAEGRGEEARARAAKRSSPEPAAGGGKRRASVGRLDIVKSD